MSGYGFGVRTGAALLVAAVGLLSLGSTAAPAAPKPSMAQEAATGTVTALDLGHVAVGKLSCLLGSGRIDSEAQEFAVGERVTIDCQRGLLRAIALAPVTGPRRSGTYVDVPPSGAAALPSTLGATGAVAGSTPNGFGNVITVNWNFVVFGPQPSITGSFSLTSTIDALGQNAITVGDDTCPFGSATGTLLGERLQLGETVTISCTLFSNGGSSGSLSADPG
jgi:hypothetical protein